MLEKPTNTIPKMDGIPGLSLALGGGMARGFSHIGVLKVLEREGIRPSFIAGTSIGAVVGACYLTGQLKELEKWALSLNRYKVLSYLDIRVRSAGLIGGHRLSELLNSYFEGRNIEDLPWPFASVACDLMTGHEVWLRKGSLIDAMRASFALPGVFTPVYLKERFLVDGALVNPVPVSVCQSMGAVMTIAVNLNADVIGKAQAPGQNFPKVAGFDLFDERDVNPAAQKEFLGNSLSKRLFRRQADSPSLFGVMVSSLNIIQDRLSRSRLAGDPPDIHIQPKIGHIGLLEFEKAEELIRIGEVSAEKMLPDIIEGLDVLLPGHVRKS